MKQVKIFNVCLAIGLILMVFVNNDLIPIVALVGIIGFLIIILKGLGNHE